MAQLPKNPSDADRDAAVLAYYVALIGNPAAGTVAAALDDAGLDAVYEIARKASIKETATDASVVTKRVHFAEVAVNSGIAVARGKGVADAAGEWIVNRLEDENAVLRPVAASIELTVPVLSITNILGED